MNSFDDDKAFYITEQFTGKIRQDNTLCNGIKKQKFQGITSL